MYQKNKEMIRQLIVAEIKKTFPANANGFLPVVNADGETIGNYLQERGFSRTIEVDRREVAWVTLRKPGAGFSVSYNKAKKTVFTISPDRYFLVYENGAGHFYASGNDGFYRTDRFLSRLGAEKCEAILNALRNPDVDEVYRRDNGKYVWAMLLNGTEKTLW